MHVVTTPQGVRIYHGPEAVSVPMEDVPALIVALQRAPAKAALDAHWNTRDRAMGATEPGGAAQQFGSMAPATTSRP